MTVRFESLEPSFIQTGNIPTYKAQFIDPSIGDLADPDSVDKVEIKDSDRNTLRTYSPPEVSRISTGLYEVEDVLVDDPGVLYIYWTWTEDGKQTTAATAFEVFDTTDRDAEKAIKEHVFQKLGRGHVHVHLPKDTIDTCLTEAKKWYATWLGEGKVAKVNMTPSQQNYTVAPDCYYVYEVNLPFNASRFSDALGAFGIFGLDFLNIDDIPADEVYHSYGFSHRFYSTITLAQQYGEMAGRVLGSEVGWEWVRHKRELAIIPEPPSAGTAQIKYVSTTVDLSESKVEHIAPKKYHFIENYALAEAKEALGRIRGKFDSFPGAESDISLDAGTLLSESQSMKDSLTEKLKKLQHPGWPIQG